MPDLPNFSAWPEQAGAIPAIDLQAAYSRGWQGAIKDPAAEEALVQLTKETSGYGSLADAAHDNNWADSGKGELVIPFVHVLNLWPGGLPGDAQTVGSCVSHSQKNANLVTLACEIVAAKPDPETGKVEGKPLIPQEGIDSGILSAAPIYWARGYNGHGWSCPTAARVSVQQVGCVPMMNYPDLGVDLTNCTQKIECLYGSRKPPEEWQKVFAAHRLASAAECKSFDEVRDALFNGYGVSSCGSEGWSSSRDENGFSRRQGSWAHAMAYVGVDDRDVIKQKYGEPLVLIQNSWGKWNSGGQRILGTTIDIPPGSFWAKWSDCKRRYAVAMANVNGWPPQKLPSWGTPRILG